MDLVRLLLFCYFCFNIYLACIFSYLSSSANERWIQTKLGPQPGSLQGALTSLRVHNWKWNFFHDDAFFAGFAENIFSWKYHHKWQRNLSYSFSICFLFVILILFYFFTPTRCKAVLLIWHEIRWWQTNCINMFIHFKWIFQFNDGLKNSNNRTYFEWFSLPKVPFQSTYEIIGQSLASKTWMNKYSRDGSFLIW